MTTLSKRISDLLSTFEKECDEELKKKILKILNEDVVDEQSLKQSLKETCGFISKKPLPDLEWFKSLSQNELNFLLEEEKKLRYDFRVVYRANIENKPTEFVVFLIEKGFTACQYDTVPLSRNGNLELIKYYQNLFNDMDRWKTLNLAGAAEANHPHILKYFLTHKEVFDSYSHSVDTLMAIHKSLEQKTPECLKVLLEERQSDVSEAVYRIYSNKSHWSLHKPNNQILLFLWDNGLKWTENQARHIDNSFMRSFFN